jgi:HNH endonuclease
MTPVKQMTPEEIVKFLTREAKTKLKRAEYSHRTYEKHKEEKKEERTEYREGRKEAKAAYDHDRHLQAVKDDPLLNHKHNLKYKKLYDAYNQSHKKERFEYNLKYRLAHKLQIKLYMQIYSLEYAIKNKEKISLQHHEHYFKNREHILAQQQQQYREHPEAQQVNHALRRARMLEASGFFTKKDFRLKCEVCDNMCVYCGEVKRLGPDHVIPLARGGSNYIENILPVCKSCNCSKGTKTLEEFLALKTQEEQEEILVRIYLLDHPEERLKEDNGN